ncbi:MAG: hypothetical protein GY866_15360, partial [Proteobacteria bacterium]|nr:hypothetical protein [Pseudomonadota bacterium]
MTELNKIGLPKLDVGIQSGKNDKESSVPGKAFEDQLIETVQKLQTMGNEIDAMMESTQPRNADVIDKNV